MSCFYMEWLVLNWTITNFSLQWCLLVRLPEGTAPSPLDMMLQTEKRQVDLMLDDVVVSGSQQLKILFCLINEKFNIRVYVHILRLGCKVVIWAPCLSYIPNQIFWEFFLKFTTCLCVVEWGPLRWPGVWRAQTTAWAGVDPRCRGDRWLCRTGLYQDAAGTVHTFQYRRLAGYILPVDNCGPKLLKTIGIFTWPYYKRKRSFQISLYQKLKWNTIGECAISNGLFVLDQTCRNFENLIPAITGHIKIFINRSFKWIQKKMSMFEF